MPRTCFLVWTTRLSPCSRGVAAQLALGVRLDPITTINEKGPYDTFPYESTQTAKMPRIAPNWQIWMCMHLDDGMLGKIKGIGPNLSCTSPYTCLVGTLGGMQ